MSESLNVFLKIRATRLIAMSPSECPRRSLICFRPSTSAKKEQRALAVAACELELLAGQCKKAATVVETRQVVGERKVSQFLLGHALPDGIAGRPNEQTSHNAEEFLWRIRRVRNPRDFAKDLIEFVAVAREDGACKFLAEGF